MSRIFQKELTAVSKYAIISDRQTDRQTDRQDNAALFWCDYYYEY